MKPKLLQNRGMIDRLMAVARNQNFPAPPESRHDRSQYTAGTPIDQKKGFRPFFSIQPVGPLLGLLQNPFRMMQVIKTVYLRDIDPVILRHPARCPAALMPRHMIRIMIAAAIGGQLRIQTAFFCRCPGPVSLFIHSVCPAFSVRTLSRHAPCAARSSPSKSSICPQWSPPTPPCKWAAQQTEATYASE